MFVTDRIIAFATGRPCGIPEDIIEIPLPEDRDFFPDPSRNGPENAQEVVEPVPYVQIVKLMIICGRISNVLNGRRGRARTLVDTVEPLPEVLIGLQERLLEFYSGLPESLKWSGDNFKHQEARGHGVSCGVFRCWYIGNISELASLGERSFGIGVSSGLAEEPLRNRDAIE
jgi:hypothetical protein